jgi:hypothetical protein
LAAIRRASSRELGRGAPFWLTAIACRLPENKGKSRFIACYAELLIRASAPMKPDDLTRPLKPMPRKQRRGIVLPIVAGTLSGVLFGLAILLGADLDRGKRLSAAPAPQPAFADSVQQTAPLPPPALTVPTAKSITITVIDSQTGAKREVVVPAPTNDQSEEDDISPGSTATVTPAELAGRRTATKSKRH